MKLELELLVNLGPKLVATLGYGMRKLGRRTGGLSNCRAPSERNSTFRSSSADRGCFTSSGASSRRPRQLEQEFLDFALEEATKHSLRLPILRWAVVCFIWAS